MCQNGSFNFRLPERVDEGYWIPVPESHPEDGYQPCIPEEDAQI